MSEPDLLFTVRNNFYLGAYQAAIAEAADLERLSDADATQRDCYVYRSYIELGSYEVCTCPDATSVHLRVLQSQLSACCSLF